jgi:PAS domain S-box-containing protein
VSAGDDPKVEAPSARGDVDQQIVVLESLLEVAPLGFAFVDRTARFVRINEALARPDAIFGGAKVGATVREVSPSLWPTLEPLYRRALAGETVLDQPLGGSTTSGESKHWLVSYYPVRAKGAVLGVGLIANDVTDRVRAEQETERVATISRRLAAIVESSEDAIVGKDLDGIVTSWNSGAEALFGYTAAEMVGTSIFVLVPPDRVDEETRLLQRIRRGESVVQLETVRRTKDGRLIDLSITASPIRDASGHDVGASKIARDVSAVKAREREIARLTRLYAALSQVNQVIVLEHGRDELFRKICRILVEQGGFRMAWIGWHDPATRTLSPIASWGDEDDYLRTITVSVDETLTAGEGSIGAAFREVRPYLSNDLLDDAAGPPWRSQAERLGFRASAVFPICENGRVSGALTVYAKEKGFFQDKETALLAEAAADVSFALDNLAREEERKRAGSRAHSEMLFSDTMIESMPGVMYFYDHAGRFLRWNRNFERVTQYSSDEIARMHPLDFFSSGDKRPLEERIAEVFAAGESAVESSLLAKDGSATPFYFTGRRVDLDGTPCLVGMGVDISKRKQAESALRELNETLEAKVASRTEELRAAVERAEAADRIKSTFLATMSHELRTPLNSIIGFTGTVLQGLAGPLTAEQTKQLGMVRTSARHLLALINDVLDISKIEAEQLQVYAEPFDLRASLERAVSSVTPFAEKKGLSLVARVAPSIGEMVSDRRRVEQIVLNLLNNAIKFTANGGVTLECDPALAYQRSPGDTPTTAVRVRVRDSGIGVAAEELSKLFQPFRQIETGLTRKHEGTGLGLAISRKLALLLDGDIVATSEPGRGSEFTVTLPLHLERQAPR